MLWLIESPCSDTLDTLLRSRKAVRPIAFVGDHSRMTTFRGNNLVSMELKGARTIASIASTLATAEESGCTIIVIDGDGMSMDEANTNCDELVDREKIVMAVFMTDQPDSTRFIRDAIARHRVYFDPTGGE